MAAAVEAAHFEGATGIPKQPGSHPTPGLLHQMTSSPWLVEKLRPRTTGTLLVYVKLPGGQTSSYKVESSDNVKTLKEKVAATEVTRALETNETDALLYMGRELGDDEPFEGALVADRAMLVRPGCVRETKAALAAFVEATKAPASQTLYERIKHEPKRGLDLDYDVRSWHYLYTPYAVYKPPVAGAARYQSAEYELTGDQAWRRDYYYDGPGDHAVVNNAYAMEHACEETECFRRARVSSDYVTMGFSATAHPGRAEQPVRGGTALPEAPASQNLN